MMETDNKLPAMPMMKKTEDKKEAEAGKTVKLKDAKVKKPELMSSKANIDVSPKRPRGRPPLNREYSHDLKAASPPRKPEVEKSSELPQQPQKIATTTAAFKLPSLKMDKIKVYNFTMQGEKITISINNNLVASKIHEVKCTSQKYNWTALLSSHVVTVGASQDVIVILCRNGTLHLFSPLDRGQRLFPPIQLPSPASKVAIEAKQLAVVTTCGHLFLWTLDPRPKIKMSKENVQSLFTNNNEDNISAVAKIIISPEVILITSTGRSFTFDRDLGSWLCLTDTSSFIQSCSSYATATANLPPETSNLPLASLGYLTPTQMPRLQSNITDETKVLATLTHCRNQRLAAEYLNSPKEYQYWLLAEVRQMAATHNTDGIKTTFDWLMGPVHSATRSQDQILGCLNKRDLLKAALDVIKGNLNLQRLYTEYHDQLNSADEVGEIDKFLHV